jgi:hypothetical protein
VAIGIGLMGLPVWSVTRSREAPPVVTEPVADDNMVELDLVIESSSPCDVVIMNAGEEIVSTRLESPATQSQVKIPNAGADLIVRATLGGSTARFVVRVEAKRDGSTLADSSFWGAGQLTGVMPIPPLEEAR